MNLEDTFIQWESVYTFRKSQVEKKMSYGDPCMTWAVVRWSYKYLRPHSLCDERDILATN